MGLVELCLSLRAEADRPLYQIAGRAVFVWPYNSFFRYWALEACGSMVLYIFYRLFFATPREKQSTKG
jgi:hypothetical protein